MIDEARKLIHEAIMRRLLAVLGLLLGLASGLLASVAGASAQEYEIPTLRGADSWVPDAPGPLYRPRWSGFYVGGQLGFGVASVNFANATQELVAHELRQLTLENEQRVSTWQVLGQSDTRGPSFGGFLGYNIGWESLILGFELNYSWTDFSTDAPISPLGIRTSAGGNVYDVFSEGSASMHITDYGTLRARAGYIVENFMPYAMIGVAFGRADIARSATVSGFQNPPAATAPPTPCGPPQSPNCVPLSFSEAQVKKGAYIYGWSLGGGLEIMVMPKVFLRAEYEYIAFVPVWEIKAQVQTARVALGYKF